MSADHSDCRCTIRGDWCPVTGSRYATFFLNLGLPIGGWFWCIGNGVGHIDIVKLRRARLVPGLVTSGSITVIFMQATKPGHPSVGKCNEYTGGDFGEDTASSA